MAEQSNRLAKALVGVVVIALGAVLLIMGSSHFYGVSAFGLSLPPEVPGAALLVVGFAIVLQSARSRNPGSEAGESDTDGDDTMT